MRFGIKRGNDWSMEHHCGLVHGLCDKCCWGMGLLCVPHSAHSVQGPLMSSLVIDLSPTHPPPSTPYTHTHTHAPWVLFSVSCSYADPLSGCSAACPSLHGAAKGGGPGPSASTVGGHCGWSRRNRSHGADEGGTPFRLLSPEVHPACAPTHPSLSSSTISPLRLYRPRAHGRAHTRARTRGALR